MLIEINIFDVVKEMISSEKEFAETNYERLKKALKKKQLDRF